MNAPCEIVERDVQPSLVIRTRCSVEDLPRVLGEAYQKIVTHLGNSGHSPAGPPFVAYHNDDMQDLDLEIGFPVKEALQTEGDIEASEIPQGSYASTMHIGPYNQVAGAYQRLSSWVETEGRKPAGPAYELYLNDPATTPESALQTLILFPLL